MQQRRTSRATLAQAVPRSPPPQVLADLGDLFPLPAALHAKLILEWMPDVREQVEKSLPATMHAARGLLTAEWSRQHELVQVEQALPIAGESKAARVRNACQELGSCYCARPEGRLGAAMLESFKKALLDMLGKRGARYKPEWRAAVEAGDCFMAIVTNDRDPRWFHWSFVRWGPSLRPVFLAMRPCGGDSHPAADPMGGGSGASEPTAHTARPSRLLLAPCFAPPSAGFLPATWWLLAGRDLVASLPLEPSSYLELAWWRSEKVTADGAKAQEVVTDPTTRRAFWAGRDEELRRRGPAFNEPDEEELATAANSSGEEASEESVRSPVFRSPRRRATEAPSHKTLKEDEAFAWLQRFAPGHAGAHEQELDGVTIRLAAVKGRRTFEARFLMANFPKGYPPNMRLHQSSRSRHYSDGAPPAGEALQRAEDQRTPHEALRIVLLWLWRKFAIVVKHGRLPRHVARMIGATQTSGEHLPPCEACARGDCQAMEEGAALGDLPAESPAPAAQVGGGASQPAANAQVGGGASQPAANALAPMPPAPGSVDRSSGGSGGADPRINAATPAERSDKAAAPAIISSAKA